MITTSTDRKLSVEVVIISETDFACNAQRLISDFSEAFLNMITVVLYTKYTKLLPNIDVGFYIENL